MLAILLGTADGLLEIVPGEEPMPALEGLSVNALDYRAGVAVAAVEDRGVWAHMGEDWKRVSGGRGDGWQQVWEGNARTVRAAPGGELYIGGGPPALFSVLPGGGGGTNELWALRAAVQTADRLQTPEGAKHPYVAGIAFPDSGPEQGLFVGVAGGGMWYAPDSGGGVSIERFERRSAGLDAGVTGMWSHPERAERLFASTVGGFFRSEDAGLSWVRLGSDLDRGWAGNAVVLPGAPDVLLLSCARRAPGREAALFRSRDGGVTWARVRLGEQYEWDRAPLLTRLWESEDTVFAFAGSELWASHDAGASWVRLADGLPPATALAAAL